MGILGAVASLLVASWATALSAVDVRSRRLPNVLTVGGTAVILAGAAVCGRALPALAGALALSAPYLLVHLIDPRGLGGGDVKLALGLGGLTGALGTPVWVLGALGAPLLTALLGCMALVWHRRGFEPRGASMRFPHGASMCAASLLAAAAAVF